LQGIEKSAYRANRDGAARRGQSGGDPGGRFSSAVFLDAIVTVTWLPMPFESVARAVLTLNLLCILFRLPPIAHACGVCTP
jgi:hypothetical protein